MNGEDLKLLARRAESVRGRADQRLEEVHAGIRSARRRRAVEAASGAAALVVAVAVGIALLTGSTGSHQDNAPPISRGTTVNTPTTQPEPTTRKLVYVDGFWPMRKIHVGNQTVDISDQLPPRTNGDDEWGMVFLHVSGDGVVLLTHDGRIWFTDGNQVVPIGQTGSATRIISLGVLKTGLSGSIAAWVDGTHGSPEMVAYDTTQRTELARIPCPRCSEPEVAGSHVYWQKNDDSGRVLTMMFDPVSGEAHRVPATAQAEDLASHPRALIVGDSRAQGVVGTGLGQEFLGVDGHLVPLADPDEPGVPVLTKAWDTGSGKQLDLRLPAVYDDHTLRLFDWVDDDRMALTANDDIGRPTDILLCRVSAGSCHVAVPGTAPRFVPNIGFD